MPLTKQALPVPLAIGENLGEDPRQSKSLRRMINCYIKRTGEIQKRPGAAPFTVSGSSPATPASYHGTAGTIVSGKGLLPVPRWRGNLGRRHIKWHRRKRLRHSAVYAAGQHTFYSQLATCW